MPPGLVKNPVEKYGLRIERLKAFRALCEALEECECIPPEGIVLQVRFRKSAKHGFTATGEVERDNMEETE